MGNKGTISNKDITDWLKYGIHLKRLIAELERRKERSQKKGVKGISRVTAYERAIKTIAGELADALDERSKVINLVDDPVSVTILQTKYIFCEPLTVLADELHYSYDTIRSHLHYKAIKDLAKVIPPATKQNSL